MIQSTHELPTMLHLRIPHPHNQHILPRMRTPTQTIIEPFIIPDYPDEIEWDDEPDDDDETPNWDI